ncbi:MAG: transcriptional regulator, LuxR family [Solirubrobacterales bacterium]|nr:transcriptional regulator, LuxR family [Solirubrobacterales bacterium]
MTAPLVGREREADVLEAAIDAAQAGRGGVVVITGEAGIGKTRLVGLAREQAAAVGMPSAIAVGDELERHFPWGIARTLLSGVASTTFEPEADNAATIERLARTLAVQATDRGLLLGLDDAHWSDEQSLRLIHYLGRRAAELPLLVLIARRVGERDAPEELLRRLDGLAAAVLRPKPLDGDGIATLARATLGDQLPAAMAERFARLSAGNPFYAHELLRAVASDAIEPSVGVDLLDASADDARIPANVARSVLVRVGRLGPDAVALARAVMLLGDGAELALAAELARLPVAGAAAAAVSLAGASILEDDARLRFVHPLVREVLAGDLPAAERALGHLQAAALLDRAGADSATLAQQLLRAATGGGTWVAERLRESARRARRQGAPGDAVIHLDRALREPDIADRAAVMRDRAHAAVEAGHADASDLVATALDALGTGESSERAGLERALGHASYVRGRYAEAADAFARARADVVDQDDRLACELRCEELSAALLVPGAGRRIDALLEPMRGAERAPDPALRAQAALIGAMRGEPASRVVEDALGAWDEGALLEAEGPGGLGWVHVTGALHAADAQEDCVAVCDSVLVAASRRGAPAVLATAWYTRAIARVFQGRVREAAADAEQALAARRDGWAMFEPAALRALALCRIEQGELDAADALLSEAFEHGEQTLQAAGLHWAVGRLRLAQGRAAEAADAFAAAERGYRDRFGFEPASGAPWDAGAALAAAALGDRRGARERAERSCALAERSGSLNLRLASQRALAAGQTGEDAVQTLARAAELGDLGPPRLEHVSILVDLGTALRRVARPAAAREPLRRALDLAARGGLETLTRTARTELQVVGARPRRAALGGRDALTPSELRVAELVAAGMTNRQVAAALFVTVKAVEFHLGNIYRKLDVRGRESLASAMSAPGQP